MLRNTESGYGLVSIVLHWLVAVCIFGLFGLGLWMVELSYYHAWYYGSTETHKSVGMLLGGVLVIRLLWRLGNARPAFEPNLADWERLAALSAHWAMYLLMFGVVISGYLILAADGSPVGVFGWFEVPALTLGIARQEDLAGQVHYWGAWALIGVASLHTLAALKHHFLERDRTLVKMLRPGP